MQEENQHKPLKIVLKTLKAPKESAPMKKPKGTYRAVDVKADADFDNTRFRKERGRVLKYLRESKGLTQREVAPILGTSNLYYNNIERGMCDVSLHTLDKWLSILGGRVIVVPSTLI